MGGGRVKPEPLIAMALLLLIGLWLVLQPTLRRGGYDLDIRVGSMEILLDRQIGGEGVVYRVVSPPAMAGLVVPAEGLDAFLEDRIAEWQERPAWARVLLGFFNITRWTTFGWVAIGLIGQGAFFGRMLVQWVISERSRISTVPEIFWWFSFVGGVCLFAYFVWRKDVVGRAGAIDRHRDLRPQSQAHPEEPGAAGIGRKGQRMKLVMDGKTISDDLAGIASAVDLARSKAAELGRLIIEINADGSPADELLDTLPDDSAGVTELGVVTADKGAFLSETLHDAKDALAQTVFAQHQAVKRLDLSEIQGGMAELRDVLEGWQAVRTIVEQASILMETDLQTLDLDGTPAVETVVGLAGELSELRDAVSTEDWSALGDLLGFDLEKRAESWNLLLNSLIGEANRNDAGVETE